MLIDPSIKLFPKELDFIPELHLVGGAVRDILLGKPVHDYDFSSPASPDTIIELAEDVPNVKIIPTGIKHGTVTVVTESGNYEITTFRTESNHNGRTADVSFTNKLIRDLARRDFTINSMAIDRSGDLIDPFDGLVDLFHGILRTTGNPEERFREDYLRIIRAMRFANRYTLRYAPQTADAIRNNAPDLCKQIRVIPGDPSRVISIERVVDEIFKAFQDQHVAKFLNDLYRFGIIDVILPEYANSAELLQNPKYHPEGSVWNHVVQTTDNAPPEYRMHALLHDVGKPATASYIKAPQFATFHRHEVVGAELVPVIGSRLKLPGSMIREIATCTALHMKPLQIPRATPAKVRKFQLAAGDHLEALKQVVIADTKYRPGDRNMELFNPVPEEIKPVLLGRHLIAAGYKPGPAMGYLLDLAFKYQVEHGCTDKDELLKMILYKYKKE